MGATLDALHKLQALESQLYALRQEVDKKKREVRVQKRRLKKAEEDLAEKTDEAKRQLAAVDRLELERKGREEEIAKLREQMKITKTNKEYAAIRVQINTLDANNRKLEDRILELMSVADELKAGEAKAQAECEQAQKRLAKLEEELAEVEKANQPKVDELLSQREEATYDVPASALQAFELVADRHESQALAKIVRPNRKREEFICSGCQMGIPLETVNSLMNTEEVQICHVCGRILYLDQDSDEPKKKAAAPTDQAKSDQTAAH